MSDCAKSRIIEQIKVLAASILDADGNPLAVTVVRGVPLGNALTDAKLPCIFVTGMDDTLAGAQYEEDCSTDWMVGVGYMAKRTVTTDNPLADIEALDATILDAEARIRDAMQDASLRPVKIMRWVKTLTPSMNQSLPLGCVMPVFNAGYLQPAGNQFYDGGVT